LTIIWGVGGIDDDVEEVELLDSMMTYLLGVGGECFVVIL